MAYDAQQDMCLGFFADFWNGQLLPELPRHAKVLEIGCAEADWLKSMRQERPDLHLTGIDWRPIARPAADRVIEADVLVYDFEPEEFDAIIAVSMVEWCGLNHYGDPSDPAGDIKVVQRARRWLKSDGWMYFDVPFAEHALDDYVMRGALRAYSREGLERRLFRDEWLPMRQQTFAGNGHPDGPYIATLMFPV